ncbi:MAG: hypothetical protein LQ350_007547 [Teloschistes chrysophthalmus]|nr:MAG: hypothetical protein LQ350_007547 [Niorma chrysophthalma]
MLEEHIGLPTFARSGHPIFPIGHSILQAPLPKIQQDSSRSLAGNDIRADNGLSLTERFTYVPSEYSEIANAKLSENQKKARQLNKTSVTSQLPSTNASHTVGTDRESRSIRKSTRAKRINPAMSGPRNNKDTLTTESEMPVGSATAYNGAKAMALKRPIVKISSSDSDSTLSEEEPSRHVKVPRCDARSYLLNGNELSLGRESMGRAGYAVTDPSKEGIEATLQPTIKTSSLRACEPLPNDQRHALDKAEKAIAEVLKKLQHANATARSIGGLDAQSICVRNKIRAAAEAITLYAGMTKHLGRKAGSIFAPAFDEACHERINTMIKQIHESAQPPAGHAPFPGRLRKSSPPTAIPNFPKSVSNPVEPVPTTAAETGVPSMAIPNMPQSGVSNSVGPVSSPTTTTLPSFATIRNMPGSGIRNPFRPVSPPTTTPVTTQTPRMQTPQTQTSQVNIYTHTILRIYHPASDSTYVPVKLRSCLTVNNLFATASKAWDVPLDKIAALIIRSQSGTVKNMRIKMEVPDSFECFVDMLEKLWDAEKGDLKIHVNVEVKA